METQRWTFLTLYQTHQIMPLRVAISSSLSVLVSLSKCQSFPVSASLYFIFFLFPLLFISRTYLLAAAHKWRDLLPFSKMYVFSLCYRLPLHPTFHPFLITPLSHPTCDWDHNYSSIKSGEVISFSIRCDVLPPQKKVTLNVPEWNISLL